MKEIIPNPNKTAVVYPIAVSNDTPAIVDITLTISKKKTPPMIEKEIMSLTA